MREDGSRSPPLRPLGCRHRRIERNVRTPVGALNRFAGSPGRALVDDLSLHDALPETLPHRFADGELVLDDFRLPAMALYG